MGIQGSDAGQIPGFVGRSCLGKTRDGGATTSNASEIYLVPAGAPARFVERADSIFGGDHVKDLKITWKDSKLLEIQYEEARILSFKNFWQSREIQNFHYVVEIRLAPIRADFSLPTTDRSW